MNLAPLCPWRLARRLACAAGLILALSLVLPGQDAPAPGLSPPLAPDAQSSSASRPDSSPPRDVSFALLPYNLARDQRNIWSYPRQLAQGKLWSPTVVLGATTVALLSADPHVQPYFARTRAFRTFDHLFASKITGAETILVPSALYFAGRYTGDSYMEKTALFAGEAVADSEILRIFLNSVTTRWRPQDIYGRRAYWNTFFHSPSYVGSSFPSGHMIAAASVATVIARRYRTHRWVPWAAYGLAGAIGFSRITLLAHFPSDVVLGTVLGYAVARYDVLQNR